MLFVVLGFTIKAETAFGARIEVGVTIDSAGNVSGTIPSSVLCSYKHLRYTGGFISSYAGVSCGSAVTTISGTLEDGFNNGAAMTDDDLYIIELWSGLNWTGDSIYFYATRSGGLWSGYGASSAVTRIDTVTPTSGSTISTSTTHTIGATGYLNASDLNDYSKLKIHLENSNTSFVNCADVICSEFAGGRLSRDFEYSLITDGHFSYSSTTAGLPVGKYYVTTKIEKGSYCLLGYCALTTNIISSSTSFIVGTTTKIDKLKDNANNYINTLASSTVSSFTNCGIADFDLFECGSDLITWSFVPTPDAMQYFGDTLHNDILTHFPLGYVTDIVDILSTSTVGTLTPIDATIPPTIPGAGSHINLDLTGSLDQFLNATTGVYSTAEASSTETLYEITNRYWSYLIYALTIFYLASRILGSQLIPKFRHK